MTTLAARFSQQEVSDSVLACFESCHELPSPSTVGSLRAGECAAEMMTLVHSARPNGHDVHGYRKDMQERLPAQPANRNEEPLPHRWQRSAPT